MWGHYWDASNGMTINSMVAPPRFKATASGFAYVFVKAASFFGALPPPWRRWATRRDDRRSHDLVRLGHHDHCRLPGPGQPSRLRLRQMVSAMTLISWSCGPLQTPWTSAWKNI
jgi:hypothetical protein